MAVQRWGPGSNVGIAPQQQALGWHSAARLVMSSGAQTVQHNAVFHIAHGTPGMGC